jgi:hypothetical protein
MVSDPDIWRAASLLIQQHGDEAELVADKRSAEMLIDGDLEGREMWVRIRRAIIELQARPLGRPN